MESEVSHITITKQEYVSLLVSNTAKDKIILHLEPHIKELEERIAKNSTNSHKHPAGASVPLVPSINEYLVLKL